MARSSTDLQAGEDRRDEHAAALADAGAAPPSLAKTARARDQRMAFGRGSDRLLQLVLHRGLQQPGCVPFIATASDDASHKTIIRLCRMVGYGRALADSTQAVSLRAATTIIIALGFTSSR